MKRTFIILMRIGLAMGCVALPGLAEAQTGGCPPLPNQVTVKVNVKVTFDATNNVYTYSYTVASDPASVQEVDDFSVDVTPPTSSFQGPPGWTRGRELKWRSTVSWGAVAVAEPRRLRDDASIPPSIAQIKPGATLSGFSFQSPKPPGPVKYYVTGFAPVPPQVGGDEADAESRAEQLIERCPQLQKHVLDLAATGGTFGPSNAVAVKIDIKPGHFPNRVNVRSRAAVPVAILSGNTFDVHQVDQASVRLGSGQAAPKGAGRFKDVNGDGLLDLTFEFPIKATGLQCGDTSLFLTGKTLDGTPFSGVDSVVTVGCKRGDDDDESNGKEKRDDDE